MSTSANSLSSLKERFTAYKVSNPKSRIRIAAKDLGVSEMELLCLSIGETVTPLRGSWEELLKEIKTCGKVMALTRNDGAVHERKGEYKNVSFSPHAGLVLGEDIDLRLFMGFWKFAFAVKEPFQGSFRQSIQFFDAFGEAIHKIYLTEFSNKEGFEELVNRYTDSDSWVLPELQKQEARPTPLLKGDIDIQKFQEAWLNLKDTHDFYLLLRDFSLVRIRALELAPEGYAIKVPVTFHRDVLQKASENREEIMVFIGNRGCIQIHTGKVEKLIETGSWFNILDDDFNMHLNEPLIHESWVVKKPTADGIVTSVECYDAVGELIVQFFGKRKPGNPENENWRIIVNGSL